MALDKQKILNELGSVVNQLQSANWWVFSYEYTIQITQYLLWAHYSFDLVKKYLKV